MTWSLEHIKNEEGREPGSIGDGVLSSIRLLLRGTHKSLHHKTINLIAAYCKVDVEWLNAVRPKRKPSQRTKIPLWMVDYPSLGGRPDRLTWAMERRKICSTVEGTGTLPGTRDLNRPGASSHTKEFGLGSDSANQLAQKCGVHATWLLGADVNSARRAIPKDVSANSIKRCLSNLVNADYPLDVSMINHMSCPLIARLLFAIVRFELHSGMHLDLVTLARVANLKVDELRKVTVTGHMQVRLAVKLAQFLGVSAVWLHCGVGQMTARHNNWHNYWVLMSDAKCQCDRMDLAKLKFDGDAVEHESWSETRLKLDIAPSTMSSYRSCSRRLSARHAAAIAALLETDADWLRGPITRLPERCSCDSKGSPLVVASHAIADENESILDRVAKAKQLYDRANGRVVSWLEIADRNNVSSTWFSHYAGGRRKISWGACQKLASSLDVDAHWLWTGHGSPKGLGEVKNEAH